MSSQDRPWSIRSPHSRLVFAGFLIVAGTLLFLGNLGILPIQQIWSFWPLLIVGFGITRMFNTTDPVRKLVGLLVAVFGGIFLLINLGILHIRAHDHSWPISILLIAFGTSMLIKVLDKREPGEPIWSRFQRPSMGGASNELSDFSIMGSIKRRVDVADFRGGHALSILSTIELDLRHAQVQELGQTVCLEVSAILGSVKVRVPEQWRVQIHGASILGAYEDKTVPPASGVNAAILVITGYSFMSTIEIED